MQTLTITWVELTIGGLGLFSIFYYLGVSISRNVGKKGAILVAQLESKYIAFSQKRLSLAFLEQEKHKQKSELLSELVKETLTVIKPEVEAIIAFLNANDASDVRIRYKAQYFQNIASLMEQYLTQRNRNPEFLLTKAEQTYLLQYITDAVQADLTQRMLDLRLGNFLDS